MSIVVVLNEEVTPRCEGRDLFIVPVTWAEANGLLEAAWELERFRVDIEENLAALEELLEAQGALSCFTAGVFRHLRDQCTVAKLHGDRLNGAFERHLVACHDGSDMADEGGERRGDVH